MNLTRVRRFYLIAVWLPIIIPMAILLPYLADRYVGTRFEIPINILTLILIYSLYIAGISYALLAIWMMWWIRHHTEAQIRRLALCAPPLMGIIFTVVKSLQLVRMNADVHQSWKGVLMLSACCIGLGYIYVALVFGLRRFGAWAGFLPPVETGK